VIPKDAPPVQVEECRRAFFAGSYSMLMNIAANIGAEVSKNWRDGIEVTPGSGLLAEQFERVINVNFARGYTLLTFQVHRLMARPDEMNETIIAVFERRPIMPAQTSGSRSGSERSRNAGETPHVA
jgi:NAD(P)-dependent dehydrogenase (short-subunit alcohol dehydrogenase family)